MKSDAALAADIVAMQRAVAQLRAAGVEILSAEVSTHQAPTIHVVEHPEVTALASRYTRCILDRSTHFAVPYADCEVVWIDPTPLPGSPANAFPPLNERIPHHG